MTTKYLNPLLAIAVGAVLGAWLRWLVSTKLNHFYHNFPLGTLLVNVTGCLIIGFALAYFDRPTSSAVSAHWRLLIVTGFCGGLTTFSSFSAELVNLLHQGNISSALLVFSAHNFLSLLATFAGVYLGRVFLQ